jgi:pimeloyl-ACP methyl ester carboxylesterase
MAYWEWGDPRNPKVLVCVHGLTRQGRDFDVLAQALSADYRVICPDVVGRGQSDWLSDPAGYQIAQYASDMVTLLARLDVDQVDWLGTSMGGLIALVIAGCAHSPIRKLILNDVGPALSFQALSRIGQYVGQHMTFPSQQEAIDYLQSISHSFGPHTPEQWRALSLPMIKSLPQGSYQLHYDAGIGTAFRASSPEVIAQGEALLWQSYDAIKAPTLVLRGALSDLLPPEVVQEMGQRGPHARAIEFAGVGHAPTLVHPDQIAAVKGFLLQP